MFCTDFCSKKFEIINTHHCALKECGQPFQKNDGFGIHGKWFCKEDHAMADPLTKKHG